MRVKTHDFFLAGAGAAALALSGCSSRPPQTMAPPVAPPAPPVASQPGVNNTYEWRDVPQGQQVPIRRAVFDQGGYQLYAESGETIVVPFVNQNMYVMKFGQTSGEMYFVNEGATPVLYVPRGGYLENASAQGAHWYPFSNNFSYQRPVYIGLAPSWGEFVGMGWYPGMTYYGGYWGYNPWRIGYAYTPMIGLNFNIGGRPYYGWNSYSTYYRSNPVNRVVVRNNYNYSSVGRRTGTSSFGRSTGSSGSFGRSTSGGFSASRPSFGTSRNTAGSSGSFGSRPSSGGFGASRPTFGSGSASRPSGSFGSGSSGFSSSAPRSSGSFGGGTSGFSSGSRSSGSFGGFGRSSGSSFGGSRSSFGGGGRSFGGGRRR